MSSMHCNGGLGGRWRDLSGGLTALVVKKVRAKSGAKKIPPQPKSKEKSS